MQLTAAVVGEMSSGVVDNGKETYDVNSIIVGYEEGVVLALTKTIGPGVGVLPTEAKENVSDAIDRALEIPGTIYLLL